jgi:hypothetical protein
LFLKLQTILKRRAHPFAFLALSLAAIALLTTLAGAAYYNYELDHQAQPKTVVASKNSPVENEPKTIDSKKTETSAERTVTLGVTTPAPKQQPKTSRPAVVDAPMPHDLAPPPNSVAVSLSVNDIYQGTVNVSSAGTQCDVLQNAFDDGVLDSLDMRYNAQYKTYAVYVINGQGDSGSVWWTYTVNGKSPPYGCTGTKVKGGDGVNWKYVKK